nr:hypothetical protein [Planomonospora sp. ID82291]
MAGNLIRSGSTPAAVAAVQIRVARAQWVRRQAQISWRTRSGVRDRRTLPGPRRWIFS